MLILNYSYRLKHFLKIRSELKGRQWEDILLEYSVRLWLSALFPGLRTVHILLQRFVLGREINGTENVFMAWNSVSLPELAGFLIGLREGCSFFFSPVGQIWLFQSALGLVYMMHRDDEGDEEEEEEEEDWVYCSLYWMQAICCLSADVVPVGFKKIQFNVESWCLQWLTLEVQIWN